MLYIFKDIDFVYEFFQFLCNKLSFVFNDQLGTINQLQVVSIIIIIAINIFFCNFMIDKTLAIGMHFLFKNLLRIL